MPEELWGLPPAIGGKDTHHSVISPAAAHTLLMWSQSTPAGVVEQGGWESDELGILSSEFPSALPFLEEGGRELKSQNSELKTDTMGGREFEIQNS
jgi:hypothetical protein